MPLYVLPRGYFAIVDEVDCALFEAYTWQPHTDGYAMTKLAGKTRYFHRMVMGEPVGDVDHINGCTIDHRRSNLRVCTHAENLRNMKVRSDSTTGVKGVELTGNGRFHAYIKHEGRKKHLGTYLTIVEASRARDKAAVELHGEFARLSGI